VRVFLTGGTGFIGGVLARLLRERGDTVVALVRDPPRAAALPGAGPAGPGPADPGPAAPGLPRPGLEGTGLAGPGIELASGDLADEGAIRAAMSGCDAVVHAAAMCAVGIPESGRPAMYRANVLGTDRILRVAEEVGVDRVVHLSGVTALGDTGGKIVDETHQHSGRYVSYYDETKHLAHEIARRASTDGQDVVIAMPGAVYGPGDRSLIGDLLQRFVAGRLPVLALADAGVTAVHRDDAAAGIIACLDEGVSGESYVLGGDITTVRAMVGMLADAMGRRAPRLTVPTGLLRLASPFGHRLARVLGLPPNLAETITAADGVTYWASHAKAVERFGYAPRSLAEGLRALLPASGPPFAAPSASGRPTSDKGASS
jgi:nucleoside-diphosphate-sugar epimerase